MTILDYLDSETPAITQALQSGFRRGDVDAVGRCLVDEIRARRALVRVLDARLEQCEKEFPGVKAALLDLNDNVRGVNTVVESPTEASSGTDQVSNERLNQIDERLNTIASGLVTIVNSLS